MARFQCSSPHVPINIQLLIGDKMEDDMRLAEVAVLRQVEVACAQALTFLHQLVGCQIKLDIMTTGRLE